MLEDDDEPEQGKNKGESPGRGENKKE